MYLQIFLQQRLTHPKLQTTMRGAHLFPFAIILRKKYTICIYDWLISFEILEYFHHYQHKYIYIRK